MIVSSLPSPLGQVGQLRYDNVDEAVLRGESLKGIARRYKVSEDAFGRHKTHMNPP